ncbi:hypothetical protein [Devosia sp. A369]
MIRPLAALTILALSLGPVLAQPVAPAAPAATPDVVIDPAAKLNTSPKQANMLTGFYATQAVIELCAIALEPNIVTGMAVDRSRLETALGLDVASAGAAYAQVKADVEKTTPDCTDGSPDRLGVDAVTAIYAALPPPAAAPVPAAAVPVEPAAIPVPEAAPVAPAVPAQ